MMDSEARKDSSVLFTVYNYQTLTIASLPVGSTLRQKQVCYKASQGIYIDLSRK